MEPAGSRAPHSSGTISHSSADDEVVHTGKFNSQPIASVHRSAYLSLSLCTGPSERGWRIMSNLNCWRSVGGVCGTACRPVCVCADWANLLSLVSHFTGRHAIRAEVAVVNCTLAVKFCKLFKRFLVLAATGDIDDMWLRDSSVQLAIYLPRIVAHPALRGVFEGMLRSQAFYILQVQSI